ncbi:MAG: hypothetical protein MJ224_05915 [archaeon]|nr:hypothetical protein [archaeon]
MKKSNPFYKERVLSPLQNKSKTLKLSSEVLKEYEKHFKNKYPEYIKKDGSLNDNQIITKLLLDYLNTQCLERKEFNIDVLIAVDKFKRVKPVILAVRDDYDSLNRYYNKDITQYERLNREYLTKPKRFTNLNELYEKYFKENYFTRTYFDKEAYKTYEKFETIIEASDLLEYNHYDYEYILFRVNNYLDEFINGSYKAVIPKEEQNILGNAIFALYKLINYLKEEAIEEHEGLGKVIATDTDIYFTYTWFYKINSPYTEKFKLLNINIISEDKFNYLISKSTNKKLKEFLTVKTEYNTTNTVINLENENTELKKLLYKLIKDKKIEKEELKKIHENEIKNYEKIIKNLIKEQKNNENEMKKLKNMIKKL